MTNKEKAVVLLSGGLDSTTTLAIALDKGYDVYPIIFDYDQRHKSEILMAQCQSRIYGLEEKIVRCDFQQFGGSALTDRNIEVPTDRNLDQMTEAIPVTYVPGRNTIFLAHALSYAETLGAEKIYTGVNCLDYSGYPDCRPEYIKAFQYLANLATKQGVEGGQVIIETPLIEKTKIEIIKIGTKLGVNYSLTSSCYQPVTDIAGMPLACGKCDSCILRKQAFAEAGIEDPTRYVDESTRTY